jgi:hypothetical protein
MSCREGWTPVSRIRIAASSRIPRAHRNPAAGAARGRPACPWPSGWTQLNQRDRRARAAPPPRDNEDIERAGRRALNDRGEARLYGLWRVLYAYKSNQIEGRFDDWAAQISATAKAEHDPRLETLVELERLAYRHETHGFRAFTDGDWVRYLNHSGPDIRLMAGVERVRHLGRWGVGPRPRGWPPT